ncbi:hypothetical protein WN943_000956 [Citrus x changshan-huyou]
MIKYLIVVHCASKEQEEDGQETTPRKAPAQSLIERGKVLERIAANIMLDWFEGGILLRRVERSLWQSSGWARVLEINVAVCWRISDEVVAAAKASMVVVVKVLGGLR